MQFFLAQFFKAIFQCFFSAVNQEYETDVGKEYVIMGNSALMKCEIPSFVADLVQIISWIDSEGNSFSHKKYGTTILNTLKVSPSCMHGMGVILNSTTSCARELGGCLKEHEIVIVLTSLQQIHFFIFLHLYGTSYFLTNSPLLPPDCLFSFTIHPEKNILRVQIVVLFSCWNRLLLN